MRQKDHTISCVTLLPRVDARVVSESVESDAEHGVISQSVNEEVSVGSAFGDALERTLLQIHLGNAAAATIRQDLRRRR